MAEILDGRAIAERIREKIKQRVANLPSKPGLAVLLVGSNPASHTYVNIKQKACEEVGIHFEKTSYSATETEETLINHIRTLNARADIHGILVQLPLPSQDATRIIAEINPEKDVDGFHPENVRRLKAGEPAIASAVALGVMKLIGPRTGDAVIVSSPLFAEPLITLMKERRINAIVVDGDDPSLAQKTKTADILVVAVGRPEFLTGEMVKPGATVIDVGTTKKDGVLYGDADRASVASVAGALTPVPGGVGPMTVAMLLVNVLKAYDLQGKQFSDHASSEQQDEDPSE
ncbi:bifunctional 5,10-methylenetetrahydrofolate dehydrogenase/5,10-methenyltetrahydrofolate cyclohydrolase [Candidatus Parcubacteria bacterium]|nr:bifunctional 5,10-methylenetetrahydrofolate dehydrogenase/5,10-methenyltetrahydrofolate cyclohydrolase [Candidatus Parcubacteria bacterium]